MASALDIKRMKHELIQVAAARASLEFRIDERLDEIERIKESIKIQEAKEAELQAKIDEAAKASS
jgi:uncharacterized protein YqgV (UPF0045/DUF77 family)